LRGILAIWRESDNNYLLFNARVEQQFQMFPIVQFVRPLRSGSSRQIGIG
jgi:hypothetical protein